MITLKLRYLNRAAARLAMIAVFGLLSATATAGELKITFVGNEAFHITDGKTTLLSDFPYKSGAFGYMKYELEQVPPIVDGVCLITHSHTDHFDRSVFEAHDWSIIAPPGVLKGLATERKIPIQPVLTFKDLTIQSDPTPHKFANEHYSYLVTWHGKRLYFVGDTETPAYILPLKNIDVLFITPWLIRTIERQDLRLDAKALVVYHQKTTEAIPPFQDYRRMAQGESFTLEFDDTATTGTAAVEPLPTPVPPPAKRVDKYAK